MPGHSRVPSFPYKRGASMKAVILAGGLGTRPKPFTEIISKPLLPVGEKAVLEIQIQTPKHSGIAVSPRYIYQPTINLIGEKRGSGSLSGCVKELRK